MVNMIGINEIMFHNRDTHERTYNRSETMRVIQTNDRVSIANSKSIKQRIPDIFLNFPQHQNSIADTSTSKSELFAFRSI